MYQIDKIQYLQIGVQGENAAQTIEIDMSTWAEEFPDATFHVLFKPYNAIAPSPMLTTYEEPVLSWTVTLGATAVAGVGYTEVRAQDAETGLVKKSRIIPTAVETSVSGIETDPPASYQEWVTVVLNSAAAVLAAAHGKQVKFEIDTDTGHLMLCYSDDETVTVDTEWTEVDLGPVDAYAIAVLKGYEGTAEEFAQYMADIANGVSAAADSATAAAASATAAALSAADALEHTQSVIETWLGNHITEPEYPLDRTLAISTAAAPADMVGEIKSELEGTPLQILFPDNSYYNTSDSKFHSNTKRLSNGTPEIIKNLFVSCDTSEKYDIFQFNKVASTGTMNTDYQYISHTGWLTESGEYSFTGSVYVYIVIAKNDATVDMTPYGNLSHAYRVGTFEKELSKLSNSNHQTIIVSENRIDDQEEITGTMCDMPVNMYYNTTSHKFSTGDTRVSMETPVYTDRISVYPGTNENFFVVLLNKVADTGVLNTDYEYVSSEGWLSTEYSKVFKTPTYVYVFARKAGNPNPEITPSEMNTKIVIWSSVLDSKISGMIDNAINEPVPDYYQQHIASKCSEINAKERLLGMNGDTFVFITDTHWNFNTKHSPALVNYILKHTPVRWVYHGGDFIGERQTGYETHNYAWKEIQNMITIRGNHDKNFNASVPTDILSDEAYYGVVVRPFEEKVVADRKLYWYRDNMAQKIRYFFLDTGANWDTLSADCLNWLKTNLLALDSEWNALIFMHIGLAISGNENETNVTIATNAADVRSAIAEISGQMQCSIIGIICGHIHADGWIIDPSLGYPIMSTSCDASGTIRTNYDTVNTQAQAGTVTEQLFDTYLVDLLNHVITTVRIGEGGNRYLHYAPTAVTSSAELTPAYLTGELTWYMGNNDTSVATVSAGTVTAVGNGYALVVAKDASGNREAWNIHVG